jgi:hypothetical protein
MKKAKISFQKLLSLPSFFPCFQARLANVAGLEMHTGAVLRK